MSRHGDSTLFGLLAMTKAPCESIPHFFSVKRVRELSDSGIHAVQTKHCDFLFLNKDGGDSTDFPLFIIYIYIEYTCTLTTSRLY